MRYKKLTKEGQLTLSVKSMLKAAGIFHWKNWGGPMGYTGIADILGCYKGKMFAIELKAPTGKLTPEQERFLQNVRDNGGIAFVARSLDEVIIGLGLQDRFLIRGW
jgi:hypothetical protein